LEETKDFIIRYVWLVTTLLSMLLVNRGTSKLASTTVQIFIPFPETVPAVIASILHITISGDHTWLVDPFTCFHLPLIPDYDL